MSPNKFQYYLMVLARNRVDFVLCGGVACILHGISRVTSDLDICVRMDGENLERLIRAAKELELTPRVPEPLESLLDADRRRNWIEEKRAMVFTLLSPDSPLQLDIFLQYPIKYDALKASANTMEVEGLKFSVSSKQHLVEAKRRIQPPRKTDLRDIEDLIELMQHDPTHQ